MILAVIALEDFKKICDIYPEIYTKIKEIAEQRGGKLVETESQNSESSNWMSDEANTLVKKDLESQYPKEEFESLAGKKKKRTAKLNEDYQSLSKILNESLKARKKSLINPILNQIKEESPK